MQSVGIIVHIQADVKQGFGRQSTKPDLFTVGFFVFTATTENMTWQE